MTLFPRTYVFSKRQISENSRIPAVLLTVYCVIKAIIVYSKLYLYLSGYTTIQKLKNKLFNSLPICLPHLIALYNPFPEILLLTIWCIPLYAFFYTYMSTVFLIKRIIFSYYSETCLLNYVVAISLCQGIKL